MPCRPSLMTTRELFWPSLVVGMVSTASLITTRFVVTKVVPSTFVRTLWYIALSLLRMRLVHRTFGAVVVPKGTHTHVPGKMTWEVLYPGNKGQWKK